MENKINIACFKEGSRTAEVKDIWQWDYGQILRIQGLNLPTAVEIHFSLDEHGGEAARRIGVTKDGVTDVPIPDSMVENESAYGDSYYFFAYIYLTDETSGNTEYKIRAKVSTRSRPEGYVSGGNDTFAEILKTVNEIAEDKVDIPAPAKVGQVLSVKATDESGKPTEFEAKDMSGGVSDEKIAEAVGAYMEANPIEETDPTVPDWAKRPGKPSYTASEVGALPAGTKIPSKTSDLHNDSGFTTLMLDDLLTDNTKAAPAGMVGEMKKEISLLSEEIANGSGLTVTIKEALMNVVENIGLWKDGNGQTYIDNLRTALYNAPLSSISAVYTQSKTVYVSDNLDVLKDDLVVTGTYTDGSSAIVTDYTLSGTLTVGTSMITVSKNGKTATFEVTVTASRVPATGITLDNTTLSFTGSTPIQLTATVEPLNSTDAVVWSSSENAVATVENGLVTPVSDGSCTIYATAGDCTAECSVSVALPLNGINIGNPYLMYDGSTNPNTSGLTEEELQDKWYNAAYTAWGNVIGYSYATMSKFFLHPFTDGIFYIRMLTRNSNPDDGFFAFSNSDIGTNPTATLGKVGKDYTGATVTKLATFDSEYKDNYGRVNLGTWTPVDGSETVYDDCFVQVYKLTVPKDVFVFMSSGSNALNNRPGISEAHPYMNDLYTIFDSDPSANILQVVE